MKIVVPVKLVPDLVEELTIDESGAALDSTWLRLKISEFDDHAIEQALLLKERYGGQVVVVAPDLDGADDVLFTAAAKGADSLIKLSGDLEGELNNHAQARALLALLKKLQPDLVLTGVQAHNDLDGPLGSLLAGYLDIPYVGYVAGVTVDAGKATVRKEYPGGLAAEMEVVLPAVLGIQAAEQPPRYVAFSKIRQAMKTVAVEEQTVDELDLSGGPVIARMFQPETGEHATMITGDPDEVASRLVDILQELGLV